MASLAAEIGMEKSGEVALHKRGLLPIFLYANSADIAGSASIYGNGGIGSSVVASIPPHI